MTFDYRYPTPLPSVKGWGAGWPSCQRAKIVPHPVFWGGVRSEIRELVDLLVEECRHRGYEFSSPGCWGFACRGTKNSAGAVGGTPSFHSWGLGLDFNAQENVFGAATHAMPAWVVRLMRAYGFFWLGPAIGDWMHFSFCGSPADARVMTAKARAVLGPAVYVFAGREFRTLDRLLRAVRIRLSRVRGRARVKVD